MGFDVLIFAYHPRESLWLISEAMVVPAISIAASSWRRVVDGFDKTAETASHFVGAFSRSPAHPVNVKASSRTMILIRAAYSF
jgi:hypothetical protein